jgi:hypothetical protein
VTVRILEDDDEHENEDDDFSTVESRSGAVEVGAALTCWPTLSVCRCLNI